MDDGVWTAIAPLPQASYWNTSAVVNGEICIVGFFLQRIVVYNEVSNEYREICELGVHRCKLILENWVLVSDSEFIMEIGEEGVKSYAMEQPWHGYFLVNSTGFRRGRWIYFMEAHMNEKRGYYLRRLDTENKKVENIEYFEAAVKDN